MSISTNLSVTGRWLQYDGKINNIGRPTLQICTDQISFQSSTRRSFYASRRRDSSACRIPTCTLVVGVHIIHLYSTVIKLLYICYHYALCQEDQRIISEKKKTQKSLIHSLILNCISKYDTLIESQLIKEYDDRNLLKIMIVLEKLQPYKTENFSFP